MQIHLDFQTARPTIKRYCFVRYSREGKRRSRSFCHVATYHKVFRVMTNVLTLPLDICRTFIHACELDLPFVPCRNVSCEAIRKSRATCSGIPSVAHAMHECPRPHFDRHTAWTDVHDNTIHAAAAVHSHTEKSKLRGLYTSGHLAWSTRSPRKE